jgi:hypothetical protein
VAVQRLSNSGRNGYSYKSLIAGITPVASVPTIGTATVVNSSTVNVAFTAPGTYAGSTYTATSSPGGFTGTSATSPILVTGLSGNTAYTFTVTATNATGTSGASAASDSVTTDPEDSGVMFAIATINVGSSGTSAIDFTNIPDTYKHLQIRFGYETGDWGTLRFNNDTTAGNYRGHNLSGYSGGTTGSGTSDNIIYEPHGSNGGGRNTYSGVIDILDYTSMTKNKVTRSLEGCNYNTGGEVYFTSGLWMSTAKITRITLTRNSTNFGQYSQFALYGIKGQ